MRNASSHLLENGSIKSKSRKNSMQAKITATTALIALMATAAGTASPALAAESTSVKATSDAYTVSTVANQNYGTSDKLSVGLDKKDQKSAYVKFTNLGKISRSDKLELQLNIIGGDAGTISVKQSSTAWDEKTVTANSAPASGVLLGTAKATGGKQTLTVPLSDVDVAAGSLSVVLERSGAGISRISATESGTAPALVVSTNSGVTALPPAQLPEVKPTPPSTKPVTPPASSTDCTVSVKLVPSCGSWFGSAANPLPGESWDDAQKKFEKTAGRTMDITHYYKRGQSAMFPTAGELARQNEAGNNRILFYNWKPTGLTWRQVADGAADNYLKSLASHMSKNASKTFFLSLNAEMEDEVNQTAGSGQTATDFRDFFRHTTSVLRSNGVKNVVTVMNYTGIEKWGTMSWFKDLYPGDDVVDWIAQDPYAFGKPPVWLTDFAGMVNRTSNPKAWPGFYNWAAANFPDKPQMIGEWGVDESSDYPAYKTDFFKSAGDQLAQLPKIKAVVYWDSTGIDAQGKPLSVGRTDITTSPKTLAAFKSYIQNDYFSIARNSYFK